MIRCHAGALSAEEDYKWHICRYTLEMESCLEEEVYLLAEIEKGLENEEFTFFVQPQCNIMTGQMSVPKHWSAGRKRMEMFPLPGEFIPVLEKNKMIDRLDRYTGKRSSVAQTLD